jgi:hypothetical protein
VRSVAPRRVLLLDWAAREARTTISSRKSEIRLSLPHDDSAIPHGLTARSVPAALHARGKSTRKNLPSFFPRNPLISLDSDERIQGNPRKSNPHNRGVFGAKQPGAKKIQTGSSQPRRGSPGPLSPPSEARFLPASRSVATARRRRARPSRRRARSRRARNA